MTYLDDEHDRDCWKRHQTCAVEALERVLALCTKVWGSPGSSEYMKRFGAITVVHEVRGEIVNGR